MLDPITVVENFLWASLDLNGHTAAGVRQTAASIVKALATLEAAPAPVGVKALEWREPDDHPKDPDPDDSLFCADGIGGVYSVSVRQKVGPAYLLWWAHDPMEWTGFDTVEAAQAAAQADYETRIRSALTHPAPSDGEVKRDGWRSMDSAPKDGTLILIRRTTQWTDDTFAVVRWNDDWWQVHDGKNDHPLRGPEPEAWFALTLPAALQSQTGGDHA